MRNLVATIYFRKKDMSSKVFFSNLGSLSSELHGFHCLSLCALPINYFIPEPELCVSDLGKYLIVLKKKDFLYNGNRKIFLNLYKGISQEISQQDVNETFILVGDGIVCHNIFIVVIHKI